MDRLLVTLFCSLLFVNSFAQTNPNLVEVGKTVYAALAENDKDKFISTYPTAEEALAFFEATGKEMTEDKVKEIIAQLHEKGLESFNKLVDEAKREGVSWGELELLEVLHDPVNDNTERINVYLALDFKGNNIRLKIDDVVKMGTDLWRLTDDIGVDKSTARVSESAEEAVAVEEASYQVNKEQVANMIKYMATNLQDYKPAEVEDQVIKNSTFIPTQGTVDEKQFEPFFKSPQERLEVNFSESGTIIEGEEIWFNELSFSMQYWDFPGWQSAGPYLEINSVRDKKGQELLLDEMTLDEYMEKGLLEEPMSYSNAPEYQYKVWLQRLLEPEEEVTILGEVIWSYAKAYEAVTFTKADIGKSKQYGEATILLRQLDKNIAVFEMQNSRVIDNMQKLFANKDGHPFQAHSSMGTSKQVYDAILANNYQLSDEQVNELADQHKADPSLPIVKVFKVSGNIEQVVFYKAKNMAEKGVPFTMTFTN